MSEENGEYRRGARRTESTAKKSVTAGGKAGRLFVCASCFVRVCLFSQIIDLSR